MGPHVYPTALARQVGRDFRPFYSLPPGPHRPSDRAPCASALRDILVLLARSHGVEPHTRAHHSHTELNHTPVHTTATANAGGYTDALAPAGDYLLTHARASGIASGSLFTRFNLIFTLTYKNRGLVVPRGQLCAYL